MIVFPPIYSYTKFGQLLVLVVAYLDELLAIIQADCFTTFYKTEFGFFEGTSMTPIRMFEL